MRSKDKLGCCVHIRCQCVQGGIALPSLVFLAVVQRADAAAEAASLGDCLHAFNVYACRLYWCVVACCNTAWREPPGLVRRAESRNVEHCRSGVKRFAMGFVGLQMYMATEQ